MKLILDTHVLLWLITGSGKTASVEQIVRDRSNTVYYSAASLWEIAIKDALGKLHIRPEEAIAEFKAAGFDELPVREEHTVEFRRLPAVEGHKDPFDRMLVAQSIFEKAKFVTADSKLLCYGNLTDIISV